MENTVQAYEVTQHTIVEKKKRGRKPLENKQDYMFITFRVKKEGVNETRAKIKELLKTLS